jgi:hypothetical protein
MKTNLLLRSSEHQVNGNEIEFLAALIFALFEIYAQGHRAPAGTLV